MARESEELVEMRRVLGTQLAAYRKSAQLSQGQLAIAAKVDRTSVTHIERARSRADERFWRIADERCRADGALLAGFHAWQRAKQEHDIRVREAELAQARTQAEALRAHCAGQAPGTAAITGYEAIAGEVAAAVATLTAGVSAPLAYLACLSSLTETLTPEQTDQFHHQLTTFLRNWADSMHRRTLLQLLGWAATTVATHPTLVALNSDEQQRFARAIAAPARVDNSVIDHLTAMLAHCKRQEDAVGARAVLPTALAQQDLIRTLLSECPPAFRSRLLTVYSDLSTSLAYYFFDLNDSGTARYYCEQARSAAQDSDNADLDIYALCEISDHAAWHGDAATSLESAAAAQRLLGSAEDPLMPVLVAQRAAVGYAVDGQHSAFMAEFEKAQNGLTSTGNAPVGSLGYFLHPGYLTRMKCECLLRLGRAREAVASAQAGLATYDKSFSDGYAICTLHLGNAHLQLGEIDEAALVVGDAANLATRTRSARLSKELRGTRARMQPWQDTRAVTALDEHLAACGFALR